MAIYGKEKVGYSLQIDDDNDSAVKDSADWEIGDEFLDGTDNTKTISEASLDDEVFMVYESRGEKKVTASIEFDDGWGNIYKYETSIAVSAVVYDEPILDFSWNPDEPVINEEVTFTQKNIDTRDDDNAYGEILSVDYDHHNDGTFEQENLSADDEFSYSYEKREDEIEILERVTYSDGWEKQELTLIKTLNMKNIPPSAKYDYTEDSHCSPTYNWFAESVDIDGDNSKITHKWILYIKDGDDWSEIAEKDGNEFSFPFQFEGDYKLSLIATDEAGGEDIISDTFSMSFEKCYSPDDEECARKVISIREVDSVFEDDDVQLEVGNQKDCREAIALAIEDYKRGLDTSTKESGGITIVTDNRMANVSKGTIENELKSSISEDIMSGKIKSSIGGHIGNSTFKGNVGGRLNGSFKK